MADSVVRLSYEEVFERIGALTELMTLAGSVAQIMRITRDPKGTAAKLAAVISRDPALAMKLLRTVNSPFYGLRRTIETIEDAVVVLGFGEIERLSLAISVMKHFSARTLRGQAVNQLFLHSLVCGIAAETLVECFQLRGIEADDIFTAALLHDVGKAIIWQAMPEAAREVMIVMDDRHLSQFHAEQEVLGGANHCLVGAWASGEWNLPTSIVHSIQMHHTPLEAKDDTTLLKVIHIANAVCYHVGFPGAKTKKPPPASAYESCAFLHGNAAFMQAFRTRYEAKRALFDSLAHP